MKKFFEFIRENPYILMLAGFIIILGDVLTAQYIFSKGMSSIFIWVIGGIGVLLYLVGRMLVLFKNNKRKKR